MALNFGGNMFPEGQINASYDYFDIANGAGYDIYYGAKMNNGSYILTTSVVASETIGTATEQDALTETFTKEFDLDFDVTFNMPQNIKGKIYASIPMGLFDNSTANTWEFYAIVKAIHYDGSTETTMATGQSKTYSITTEQTNAVYGAALAGCIMDVTTVQHFKKGEILRFTVECWYRDASGTKTADGLAVGHDPKDRNMVRDSDALRNEPDNPVALANEPSGGGTLNYLSTQMQFHVPFVLDFM